MPRGGVPWGGEPGEGGPASHSPDTGRRCVFSNHGAGGRGTGQRAEEFFGACLFLFLWFLITRAEKRGEGGIFPPSSLRAVRASVGRSWASVGRSRASVGWSLSSTGSPQTQGQPRPCPGPGLCLQPTQPTVSPSPPRVAWGPGVGTVFIETAGKAGPGLQLQRPLEAR